MTNLLLALVLLAALIAVAWPFLFYPLILRMLPTRGENPVAGPAPSASLLFCAYNEAGAMPEKLANLAMLKARHPTLEILAFDDGSSDDTAALIAAQGDLVTLLRGPGRSGKAHGMKMLAARARGDVLIFTDANVLLDADAIDNLLARYADPDVGGVLGSLHYLGEGDSATAAVGSLYWRIEERLKDEESRTGNVLGADGSIFSIRRSLYPEFPDSVLDDFQYRHLELKGIHVRPNTAIGKTITIDDLFRDGYKSVFIGAGLWKANAMHIKGETLGNAAFGIDYLANSKAFRLGDDIAVIGVGNSAMDCARTAIRNGARHVTCYARRDESCISASAYEVSYAKLEGVGFRFCKAPVEIRENGLICRDTVKNEEGKFVQVEGSETFYPHTGVIVSVSQGSESNLVKTTTGIETNQKGLLTVSEDGSTTREGVFAGGDAVMGAHTVVEAVAIAKQVAESMDKYMKSLPADTTPDPYADIPTFQTPTSDVLGKQEVK